jgi:hypothetical protein
MGDKARLADPLKMMERRNLFSQGLHHLFRRQKRLDVLFNVSLIEKDGEMIDNMPHKFRDQLTDVTEPHLLEKAACPHSFFNQACTFQKDFEVLAGMGHIDDDPVMDRMMRDDISGIGQNGIVLRQRRQDVRIKMQTGYAGRKEPNDGEDEKDYKGPS